MLFSILVWLYTGYSRQRRSAVILLSPKYDAYTMSPIQWIVACLVRL